MSAANLWHDASIGQGLILLGLVWLIVKTADLAMAVWWAQRGTPEMDAQLVDETREVVRHVEAVAAVAGDVFGAVEDIGKDVAAIRDGVEQLGDPNGGAR